MVIVRIQNIGDNGDEDINKDGNSENPNKDGNSENPNKDGNSENPNKDGKNEDNTNNVNNNKDNNVDTIFIKVRLSGSKIIKNKKLPPSTLPNQGTFSF
jgi:hypothetical protein